jgi:hypothetical protein
MRFILQSTFHIHKKHLISQSRILAWRGGGGNGEITFFVPYYLECHSLITVYSRAGSLVGQELLDQQKQITVDLSRTPEQVCRISIRVQRFCHFLRKT